MLPNVGKKAEKLRKMVGKSRDKDSIIAL